MKKLLSVFVLVVLFSSCNSTKRVILGEELTTYKAAGNDMAEIYIRMYDSNKFVFEFVPFSFEKKARDKGIKEVGTYSLDTDWYTLNFPEDSQISLKDLFDQETEDSYQVLNKHTVKIHKNSPILYVWGILLEKQKRF